MDRLGYTSPRELLAEKFHMSQDLLRKLNPGASFDKEGQEIVVANVEHESLSGKISRVEVDPNRQRVKASEGDKVVALYPATVGSEDRPTPRGEFKVTKITENLVYHYDPALHFRGVHVNEKLNLPPGPSIRLTNWDALELAKHLSKGTPVVIEEGEKTGGLESQGSQRFAATEDIPLPERNPAHGGLAEQAPHAPGHMATIPWTEGEIAEAKAKCSEAFSPLTPNYEPLPPIKEGLCGAPGPILLKSLGRDPEVALDPPATVTCALAKALSAWLKEGVQPQAKALLNSPVTELHVASYTCRNRNGGADLPLSEHAFSPTQSMFPTSC